MVQKWAPPIKDGVQKIFEKSPQLSILFHFFYDNSSKYFSRCPAGFFWPLATGKKLKIVSNINSLVEFNQILVHYRGEDAQREIISTR